MSQCMAAQWAHDEPVGFYMEVRVWKQHCYQLVSENWCSRLNIFKMFSWKCISLKRSSFQIILVFIPMQCQIIIFSYYQVIIGFEYCIQVPGLFFFFLINRLFLLQTDVLYMFTITSGILQIMWLNKDILIIECRVYIVYCVCKWVLNWAQFHRAAITCNSRFVAYCTFFIS